MAKETRVGTLVLAALVIAGVTIFLLGRQQHLWERKVHYELRFARTNGLQTGAPVSFAGVPVGSVDQLRFAPDSTKNEIVVDVSLDAQVAPRVHTDTIATIRTLGLLGDKAIELAPGNDPNADAIPAGGRIPSIDPTDYEALVGQSGGDIVTNVVEVTAALKDVLQSIQRGEGLLGAMLRNREFGDRTLESLQDSLANLKRTTAALDHILEHVDHGDGLMGRLVRDPTLAASLDRSLQSIERVTRRLEHGKGAAMRLVEDEAYGDRVLAKIDRATEDLAEVAHKLNHGDGTLGKLINEPTLHDEATGLIRDVRSSWLVRIYEGLRGLWPSGGTPPAKGTEASR
jgi:phospholipid/cholesterol/gamma-HCH transport system substrate-binding protein